MATATNNFGAKLKAMKKNWKEGKVESKKMFGAEDLPDDGKYEAQLTVCKLEEMNDGKLVIAREFVLSSGEHQGILLRDRLFIENAVGAAFADRWIQNHGYESPEDPSALPEVLEAIEQEQPICTIRAKRNGNFMNVNVLAVVGNAADGAETEEEVVEEEVVEETPEGEEAAETEEEVVEEEVPGDDDELKEKLINFCAAQGIDGTEEDDVDSLKEKINGFNYKEEELTSDEVELLVEIDQEANIVRKPKAKPPVKPAAKPAAKAVPAKAAAKPPVKPAAKPAAKAVPAKAGVKKVSKK